MLPHPAPVQPAFQDGPAGAIMTLGFPAAGGGETAPSALLVPPFAEEMNRARRFLSASARALSARGVTAMLADLHGTGDSAGAFADASWAIWQAEVDALTTRLAARRGGPVQLIGLRTGALLAAGTARRHPAAVSRLTLVQPVTDGGRFLDQLLRVRVAASMAQGARETRDALRAEWTRGAAVEIGGYAIAARLAEEMTAARLAGLPPRGDLPVDWLDVVAPGSGAQTPVPALPAGWDGPSVIRRRVAAPAVWQLAEPEPAEALVAAVAATAPPQPVPA